MVVRAVRNCTRTARISGPRSSRPLPPFRSPVLLRIDLRLDVCTDRSGPAGREYDLAHIPALSCFVLTETTIIEATMTKARDTRA
jgi:hypothetical protein